MNRCRTNGTQVVFCLLLGVVFGATSAIGEEVGERWGTEVREREYYPIVSLPMPADTVIEAGAFAVLPDGRTAVGTRHGEIYLISGVDDEKPVPEYQLFATGLDEIFGLTWKDGVFYVTQSCELTRVSDTDKDGRADRFDTVSDAWGYANYHEYAFGSEFDAEGNQFVTLGLSESYYSHALYRGFVMKVSPDGKTTAFASGLRSPGGVGLDEHGALFYIESQGPWNCSCSLKAISPGSFHVHPASFEWYPYAPELGPVPEQPKSGSRTAARPNAVSRRSWARYLITINDLIIGLRSIGARATCGGARPTHPRGFPPCAPGRSEHAAPSHRTVGHRTHQHHRCGPGHMCTLRVQRKGHSTHMLGHRTLVRQAALGHP